MTISTCKYSYLKLLIGAAALLLGLVSISANAWDHKNHRDSDRSHIQGHYDQSKSRHRAAPRGKQDYHHRHALERERVKRERQRIALERRGSKYRSQSDYHHHNDGYHRNKHHDKKYRNRRDYYKYKKYSGSHHGRVYRSDSHHNNRNYRHHHRTKKYSHYNGGSYEHRYRHSSDKTKYIVGGLILGALANEVVNHSKHKTTRRTDTYPQDSGYANPVSNCYEAVYVNGVRELRPIDPDYCRKY